MEDQILDDRDDLVSGLENLLDQNRKQISDLRSVAREALDALQAARAKMPYGPRFNLVVARIDGAMTSIRQTLKCDINS